MPSSTITLEYCFDTIAAKGVPDPRNQPSGYGDNLALELGNEVMADILGGAINARGEVTRFNWKFNRAIAMPFQLNSWQQDYPQPAQAAGIIGWGEDCDILDVNNTQIPKPLNWNGSVTWKKQLNRTSLSRWRPGQICWMYNNTLSFGTWPGTGVVISPLNGNASNPILSMVDKNGNFLIVSAFGTTGATAPFLPANSVEGAIVVDGSVSWMVVSGTSQGFRVDWVPNQTSPNYQIIPSFQIEPPTFTRLDQTLNPIPNSFSRHFLTGLEAAMYKASPNPGDMKRGQAARGDWLASLLSMTGQANKEPDAFGIVPITSPVETRWQNDGLYTADRPV